jgi:hypothetical protein
MIFSIEYINRKWEKMILDLQTALSLRIMEFQWQSQHYNIVLLVSIQTVFNNHIAYINRLSELYSQIENNEEIFGEELKYFSIENRWMGMISDIPLGYAWLILDIIRRDHNIYTYQFMITSDVLECTRSHPEISIRRVILLPNCARFPFQTFTISTNHNRINTPIPGWPYLNLKSIEFDNRCKALGINYKLFNGKIPFMFGVMMDEDMMKILIEYPEAVLRYHLETQISMESSHCLVMIYVNNINVSIALDAPSNYKSKIQSIINKNIEEVNDVSYHKILIHWYKWKLVQIGQCQI